MHIIIIIKKNKIKTILLRWILKQKIQKIEAFNDVNSFISKSSVEKDYLIFQIVNK